MDELGLRISLIIKITSKKKEYLELIENITCNQNAIVLGDLTKDSRQMFMNLAKEKQKMIDEVYNLDTVFQRTYNSVKHLFNNSLSKEYKIQLKQLQVMIDNVMTLDKHICEMESSNSNLLEEKMRKLNQNNNSIYKEKSTIKSDSFEKLSAFTPNMNSQEVLSKKPRAKKPRNARIENANLNRAIAKYNKQSSSYENHKLTK